MARDRVARARGLSEPYGVRGAAVSHAELMRRKTQRYKVMKARATAGEEAAMAWLKRKRATGREGCTDRRRAAGVEPRAMKDGQARGYALRDWRERKVLDARILIAWVELHGGSTMVADRLGECDEREIYRKARVEGRITVSGCDRVLLALGYGWAMDQLYPPGESEGGEGGSGEGGGVRRGEGS